MKRLVNIVVLLALILSFIPVFLSTSPVLAVDITVDSYGAGRNDTGDPIGGGENYTDIVTTGDHLVTNKAELLAHMVGGGSEAASGEVIYIADNTAIDMTGEQDLTLPDNVTLAGNRGQATSLGARIYLTDNGTGTPIFLNLGDNCRVTGLRLEGNDNTTVTRFYGQWTGLNVGSSENVTIDNNEISGWPYRAINIGTTPSEAVQPFIYCNYIHRNRQDGYGYGVCVTGGWALVECNLFTMNRHSIVGTRGVPLTNYEAIYNIVTSEYETGMDHTSYFDCHGGNDVSDPSVAAGGVILIHFNTFKATYSSSVGIRGIPDSSCIVEYNWTYHDPDLNTEFAVFQQKLYNLGLSPYIDMSVSNNVWGDAGTLVSRTGLTDTYIGVMPTQTVTITDPDPPNPYDPPDPYIPPVDENLTTTTFSIYETYDGYLTSTDDNYTDAYDAASSDLVNYTSTYLMVGQDYLASLYGIRRGELQYNTINLPSQTTIDGARLYLWCKSTTMTSDNIYVIDGSGFGSPPVTGDWSSFYSDNTLILGQIDMSMDIPTDAYSYITLNQDGIDTIVRKGVTKFGLVSVGDYNEVAPSAGLQIAQFWTMESGHQPYLEITYGAADLGVPDTCKVDSVRVFSDYREAGDRLFAIRYTVDYNSGDPSYDPEDYFILRLFDTDGTTLKAVTSVPAWGWSRPVQIYLSTNYVNSANLVSKKHYIVKLEGVSGRFSPQISKSLILGTTGDTWRGKVTTGIGSAISTENFKKWVFGVASEMTKHDAVTYTVKIGNETKLTADGGTIFLTGFPDLDSYCPDLFSAAEQNRDWGVPGTFDPTFKNKLLNNMGTQLMTSFDLIGKSIGLTGTWVNSMLWGFFTVAVAVTGLSAGLSIAGMAVGIPALMLGLFMGIPPIIGALLGITLMFLLARTLWAARG